MYGHTYSKSMDQTGEVASPARGINSTILYYSIVFDTVDVKLRRMKCP